MSRRDLHQDVVGELPEAQINGWEGRAVSGGETHGVAGEGHGTPGLGGEVAAGGADEELHGEDVAGKHE